VAVPTAPNGDTPRSSYRTSGISLPAHVARHLAQDDDNAQLITVRHQPQGPVAYLFEPDDELVVRAVDIQGGNVLVHAEHVRWGTLFVLTNGPAVTEVCLHDDEDQRAVFRERAYELDAAYRAEFAMIEVTEERPEDPADPDEAPGLNA
jgi:hypothetical protein